MVEAHVIVGIGIIIINLIPFILRKPKLVFLTSLVSVLMIFALRFFS